MGKWHRYDQSATAIVIFVHGLNSSSESCWTSKSRVFWPDLLYQDTRLPALSSFLGDYHTSFTSGDYGISDCADELHAALQRTGVEGNPAVISSSRLIFVCHSMGGIVVRRMLEQYSEDYEGKFLGLCLFASPTLGSRWADRLAPLTKFFKNRAGAQLIFGNEYLLDLNARFARFIDKRKGGVHGAEAIEHKGFLPFLDPIVGRYSAGHYFANRRVLAGTNHSTIVKPERVQSASHEFLVDFLVDCNSRFPGAPITVSTPKEVGGPEDVLFDVYENRFEDHYVSRSVDELIFNRSAGRSLWVSGPPGVGKTCSLKRLVSRSPGSHFHVCLSQCGRTPSRDRVLQEIYESLPLTSQQQRMASQYRAVVSFLASIGQGVLVYVDEVASGDDSSDASSTLLTLLSDLATSCRQHECASVEFVVSSLSPPEIESLASKGKVREIFDFIEFRPWGFSESQLLIKTITRALNFTPPYQADEAELIGAARGSPRFIKSFYRRVRDLQFEGQVLNCSKEIAEVSRNLVADLECFSA